MFYVARSATPDYSPQWLLCDEFGSTVAIYYDLGYAELAAEALNKMEEE